MYSVEEMKSCIKEWFGEALNEKEVAKTYHEILLESELQLDYMMNQRKGNKK